MIWNIKNTQPFEQELIINSKIVGSIKMVGSKFNVLSTYHTIGVFDSIFDAKSALQNFAISNVNSLNIEKIENKQINTVNITAKTGGCFGCGN